MGIGIKEEVTALGSKIVRYGFRQGTVFFVGWLAADPDLPRWMPARTARLLSHHPPTASDVEEGD